MARLCGWMVAGWWLVVFTVDTRDQTWVSPHDFSIHPQRDRGREQRSCNVLRIETTNGQD